MKRNINIPIQLLFLSFVYLLFINNCFAQSVTINKSVGAPYCQNDFVRLTAMLSPGVDDLEYSWFTSESGEEGTFNIIADSTDSSIVIDTEEPGAVWFKVKVTIAVPDTVVESDSIEFVINALPTYKLSAEGSICEGGTAELEIGDLTGVSPWDFKFWGADSGYPAEFLKVGKDTSIEVKPDTSTIFYFTLLNDSMGCGPTDLHADTSVAIDVQRLPNAGIDGELIICNGEIPSKTQLFNALGGNPDEGGEWLPDPEIKEANYYSYIVQGTGACNAMDSTSGITVETEDKIIADSIVGKPYDNPVVLIYPQNGLEYKWYGENGTEVLDTCQYYILDGPGNYYVKINPPGSSCITTSETYTVPNLTDSMPSKPVALSFDLFPNPANANITITLKQEVGPYSDKLLVKVVSLDGISSISKEVFDVVGEIDIQNLQPGLYSIYIYRNNKIYATQKLIVTR